MQPGTQIGRYKIQRKLARGGMGTVYVAHDPVLERMVAVKVFVGDLDVPDAAERFGREARAAASLNHSNIVTIFDFGEVGTQPYIVMEYIQGETITEIIRRRTAVPVSEKVRWLEELCAGAASAHKLDVIHRDIKPSNLMIDRGGRLKILDFGIAKIINSLGGSNMTAVIGTPGYMAPEQLLGQPVDARTDIFAIGVVGFELLTYEEAFQGDSFTAVTHRIINDEVRRLADLAPDAPSDLCAVIEKCLQKNPADRYRDAESLRIALSRVRRRIERSSDFDASSMQTIVTPIAVPGRRGEGMARKPAPVSRRTAELTPPPDPVAQREALARAQRAKIQGALQRSEACLANGQFEQALAASQEVLEIDPAHAEALALRQKITNAVARQQAVALLADARIQFQRGALTRCKTLLDEARQLDPAANDPALERDLRLARVEEERKRHRTETINRTVAAARAAMDREDFEAALALAREALSLDPDVMEARDLELAALRTLEEGEGSLPTVSASVDDKSDQEKTVAALPRLTKTPVADPTEEKTQVVVPPRSTPAPSTTAVPTAPMEAATPGTIPVSRETEAPPPLPPLPPTPGTAAPPAPAPPPVTPVAAGPARDVTDAARTPTPASAPTAAPPPVSRPATPQPSPAPLSAILTKVRALPLKEVAAKARALPRTPLLVVAGVVVLALLVVAVLALRGPGTPAVPQAGHVVIEAVPWANVTAIKGADGTNRLAAPAATPLSMELPAGTYTVDLANPSSPTDTRTITIDVAAGGVTVTPVTRFPAPTSEDYFKQYFGGDAPATPTPDAGAATPASGSGATP